ncbi:2-keto-4-pentenoate hydratase [Streptomyces agglomeratus]|uniref:2-keto-4-pentenoate hydratase n=1 Tax=Streptomyces agglomeratus TaxID=285458 RepID=UPI000B27A49F|nr:fumarylacetoacetate hydrolase family protein [Streptomyces agglomeratus]
MSQPVDNSAAVRQAADLLAAAAESGPCPPVRDLLPDGNIDTAYAVQRMNTSRRLAGGHRLVGRKIGLTSKAVQQQLGVDQPDFGALLSDIAVPQGGTVPPDRLLQPKVEAEVALVLAFDLPDAQCTAEDVAAATAFAVPALEIVDSRIAGWDITLVDTVADAASSGLFVLGEPETHLDTVDLSSVQMTMSRNGQVVSEGSGADWFGSPLSAAVWLARTLARMGDPLKAGDVVLTGALGPMTAAVPGDTFTASISGLGEVAVRFALEGEASE